jgi:hypothetical protein
MVSDGLRRPPRTIGDHLGVPPNVQESPSYDPLAPPPPWSAPADVAALEAAQVHTLTRTVAASRTAPGRALGAFAVTTARGAPEKPRPGIMFAVT